MISPECIIWPIVIDDPPCGYPMSHEKEEKRAKANISPVPSCTSSLSNHSNFPAPPPLPDWTAYLSRRYFKKSSDDSIIFRETRDKWDQVFKEGYGADVFIITENNTTIPAHYSFLRAASPVLENFLQHSIPKDGKPHLKLPGVPHGAVYAFIRFLYSSCYEQEGMKKFAPHLLVLSHAFAIPQLKRLCVQFLEDNLLTTENVVDVLQLARVCDAPQLSLKCVRMIITDFKTVSSTEGWKVMKLSNPSLEQELLESVVEADSRKQERLRRVDERKTYQQLHEAMEALTHIYKDGCRNDGPHDKMLKESQSTCDHSACKSIGMLFRHFSVCKGRAPGRCVHCKRVGQLLELHSRMCNDPESCRVPLCRTLKEKHWSKREEAKWRLLVSRVNSTKKTADPILVSNVNREIKMSVRGEDQKNVID